jgi:hypothetical protein
MWIAIWVIIWFCHLGSRFCCHLSFCMVLSYGWLSRLWSEFSYEMLSSVFSHVVRFVVMWFVIRVIINIVIWVVSKLSCGLSFGVDWFCTEVVMRVVIWIAIWCHLGCHLAASVDIWVFIWDFTRVYNLALLSEGHKHKHSKLVQSFNWLTKHHRNFHSFLPTFFIFS